MKYTLIDFSGFKSSEEISLVEADQMICSYILKDWSVEVIDGLGITMTPLFYSPYLDGEFRPTISLLGEIQELKSFDRITDPIFLAEQDFWISKAKKLLEVA